MAQVSVTPAVVTWAVQRSGFSLQQIADATGVRLSDVKEWLSGKKSPTVTQARKLAYKLKRPLALLMWPEPPEDTTPVVAFRAPVVSDMRELNPAELRYIRQAHRLQQAVGWLRQELNLPRPKLPHFSTTMNASDAAEQFRPSLSVTIDDQFRWSSEAVALREWRSRLEGANLLVFFLSLGSDSCRGMTLMNEMAPVIIVNTAFNHTARIYTLFHELGHVLSRTTSACASNTQRLDHGSEAIERWCEEFAAAALMPWPDVTGFLADRGIHGQVAELSTVRSLARQFKVSLQAATLRLIKNGRASWTLWDAIPRDSNAKSGGGGQPEEPRTTPVIRLGEYGRNTVRTFVRGMDADLLERSHTASYLRVGDDALTEIQHRVIEAS